MEIKTPRGRVFVDNQTMTAKLEWGPGFESAINRQYGDGSELQKYVDYAVLHGCDPYVPLKTATLQRSGELGTIIGSGMVSWIAPYSRYLYYGKVMVDPITKKAAFFSEGYGFWSRPGVRKERTDIDLVFQGGGKRGAFWFERWKNDNLAAFMNGIKRKFGVDVEVY